MARLLMAFLVLVAASACRLALAQPSYTLIDIGVIAGSDSGPTGVTTGGRVSLNGTNGSGRNRGSLWVSGASSAIGTLGGLETLTTSIGFNTALNVPQIVGSSLTPGGSSHAFLWTQGGSDGVVGNLEMRDLGTLPGGTYSEALAVNASGRVTGYSENASGIDRAFVWNSGTMSDLGAAVASTLGHQWSYGYSINASGQVVGAAYNSTFVNSFAWLFTGTSVKSLGNLGGGNAEATAINDLGQIVGFSTNGAGNDRAFITTGSTAMRDLGTLGGPDSFATAINNSGQVVGGSFSDVDGLVYHAFVTVSGTMRDLNTLLDTSGQGWVLEEATGITAGGQIVGVATASGTSHAFLLTPAAPALTWSTTGTQAGGTGTWSGTSTTWLSGTSRTTWTGTSKAVFGGSSSTVTVSGSLATSGGLEFKAASVTLSGGTLTLVSGTFGTVPVVSVSSTSTGAIALTLAGTSGMLKAGPGMLVLRGTTTLTGPVTVQSGTLCLGTTTALAGGSVTMCPDAALKVTSLLQLSLGRLDVSAGGTIDVNDGTLTVASGLTPATTVAEILEGRGDGTWNGTNGITSSAVAAAVAATIPRAIGWLDNGDGSITVAFSAAGDTNIDGTVDILDAANFLAGGKFDSGGAASWNEGDFGYDGLVDILDAADFLSTGLFDAGPYVTFDQAAAPSVAPVPEPAAAATLVSTALATWAAAVSRRRVRGRAS